MTAVKYLYRALAITSLLFLLTVVACSDPLLRVEVPSDAHLWERSLQIATTQVGVRELTGRNDGTQVRAYLRSVDLNEGHPYCQAGQYWTFDIAIGELGMDRTAIPLLRTGSTQRAWFDAVKRGRKTSVVPHVGDLITWVIGKTFQGHVERIVAVLDGGWVRTIGFNTSSGTRGSQRDGGGVYYRYRNWLQPDLRMYVRGFIGHQPQGRS